MLTRCSSWGHFAEISPHKSLWAERRSSAFTTQAQISPSCVATAVWPEHRYALKPPDLIKPQSVCQCYSKPFFSTVRKITWSNCQIITTLCSNHCESTVFKIYCNCQVPPEQRAIVPLHKCAAVSRSYLLPNGSRKKMASDTIQFLNHWLEKKKITFPCVFSYYNPNLIFSH